MLVWSGRRYGRSDCCFDDMKYVDVVFHFFFWSLQGRKPPCLVCGVSDEGTAQVCMAHLHMKSRICWNFVPSFKCKWHVISWEIMELLDF